MGSGIKILLVHKILNLQSDSLFLVVFPPGPSMPVRQVFVFFTFTHHIKVASWV